MERDKKQISLVIPIYNALPYVKKCLNSVIKNFCFETGEVILINDNSNAETTNFLEKFIKKHSNLILVTNTENLGYVETCNKGAALSKGEIIVLLNSDTEIPKCFCKKIIDCFNSDNKIGTASPLASNSANYWLPQICSIEKMNRLLDKTKPNYPDIFNAEGFCICIKKELTDKYGLYDSCYSPGYCEEVDLSLRLYSKGYRNVLIDNLFLKHARNKSFNSKSQQLKSEHNKILYKRWGKLFNDIKINPDIIKNIIDKNFTGYKFIMVKLIRWQNIKNNSRILTFFRLKNYYRPKNKKYKRVLYTCISGDYDIAPILQTYIDKDTKYVCFTNNKTLNRLKQLGEWEIRPLKYTNLCQTKNARWHKTHPHILFPEYEESIWIDANIEILTPKIFNEFNDTTSNILIPIHYCRDDIYSEIEAVKYAKRDLEASLESVANLLQAEKMPYNYGLNETNIIFRRHNDLEIQNLMNQWWKLIEAYSKRDQLSLSYVLWKNNIKIESLSIDNARIDPLNFKFYPHDINTFTAKVLKILFS